MEKDFSHWHVTKQEINDKNKRWFYKEGEIRWCSWGLNIGFELDGKGQNYRRPVLIVKGFSKELCLCVPVTTQCKVGRYYGTIDLGDGISRNVIFSQLRTIDTKRLREKLGKIDKEQFGKIKQTIVDIIG
jgi:mRNA interferase MazF